jgi:hypothetical protein
MSMCERIRYTLTQNQKSPQHNKPMQLEILILQWFVEKRSLPIEKQQFFERLPMNSLRTKWSVRDVMFSNNSNSKNNNNNKTQQSKFNKTFDEL